MSDSIDDQEGRTYERGRRQGDSLTNTQLDSCAQCKVSCEDQWSLMQMEVVLNLCEGNQLMPDALRRARRTAGNYAALFLSDEGTPRAGRFYWPGLAAFAAKQVVDGIEYADTKMDGWLGQVRTMAAVSFYYLLKGNMWVFPEVTPWMLFYRKYDSALFDHCMERRNVNSYDPVVKNQVEGLPWAKGKNAALEQSLRERIRVSVLDTHEVRVTPFRIDDAVGALAEMGYCQATQYLRLGFADLKSAEAQALGSKSRADLSLSSTKHLLDHEQRLHLQKMVYDHRYFRSAMDNNDFGRKMRHFMGARDPELVFNYSPGLTPEIIEQELKPEGITEQDVLVRMELKDGKLYNVDDRMRYVARILDTYHRLMIRKRDYMIHQLHRIEGWKDA